MKKNNKNQDFLCKKIDNNPELFKIQINSESQLN